MTRDLVTERVDVLGPAPSRSWTRRVFSEATDAIEAEGVARARQTEHVAALTLVVLDRSQPLTGIERDLLDPSRGSASSPC